MASALKYAGYDVKFVVGTEGHNAKQGGAILPSALRWLWRDYPQSIKASTAGGDRMFVTEIADPEQPVEGCSSRPPIRGWASRGSLRRYLLHRRAREQDL